MPGTYAIEVTQLAKQAKLASAMGQAPPGALPPLVKPHSIDDVPVLALTLHSTRYDANTLRQLAVHLEDDMEERVLGAAPRA